LLELTRLSKAEYRIEECLQRAKSPAGLAGHEVRTWRGWHHYQTFSLLATWFLTQESRQGQMHTGAHHSAGSRHVGVAAAYDTRLRSPRVDLPTSYPSTAHRKREILSLEET
jgi:hypothetical protein